MAESSLQDRLRDHAKAFNGLLSLIPAKSYYGEDTSVRAPRPLLHIPSRATSQPPTNSSRSAVACIDQWQRKKQTKDEAAAARRGKLDPDSELNRNAKEVMDERARNKRKLRELELEAEGGDACDVDELFEAIDGVEPELPGQGLRKKTAVSNKKQKLDDGAEQLLKLSKKGEKKVAKREKKAEKKADKKAKRAEKPPTPAKASTADAQEPSNAPANGKKLKGGKYKGDATPSKAKPEAPRQDKKVERDVEEEEEEEEDATTDDAPVLSLDITGLGKDGEHTEASTSESNPHSPTFDAGEQVAVNDTSGEPASTTTSISSAIPPSEKPKHIKIPADSAALRARLAAKIEALRAARKADGPDGKPIRTRQELIEARRAKEAQRKAHKKELWKQAKLEEDRKREEALASNSPGVMSPAVELDESTGNFSFGRVAFGDGSQMSHDLSYVLNRGKKKGPSDPKTALLKVQHQKKRLEELDAERRAGIAEKEAWLTARRRVEGEKIRDDEAILKKAVKRKETAKKKSEKAWKERSRGVHEAQKERQKKREENLKKRRDDKLLGKAGKKKGGPKQGGAKKGGAKKKGGRPGFEGSLGVGGRKK
ncbi:Ribosomal RNA-processing protein 14 [Tolypocladium capitatum]|uniref:Ribosomal RNA-processing protein 14 n=1 Tax=Tolypocladium capitatum TaxID=45235 RepID=A0A2K3QA87_9HYPO|nr:Ribosomal RNA-processing protein 14 [Tolypocladium capitatum]